MANVCVCLLTYNRLEYAKRTLRSTMKHLKGKNLVLHIADDGSPAGYADELNLIVDEDLNTNISGGKIVYHHVTRSNSEHKGYGANYNLALQTIHQDGYADYVLFLEDDWILSRDLDLDNLVAIMDNNPGIGCIRMGYLGFTDTLLGKVSKYRTADDPDGWGHIWLDLLPSSAEKHVFAGHPRLERRSWTKALGVWPEGLLPGETELAVCGHAASRYGVVWPLDLTGPVPTNDSLFVHIGADRSY